MNSSLARIHHVLFLAYLVRFVLLAAGILYYSEMEKAKPTEVRALLIA